MSEEIKPGIVKLILFMVLIIVSIGLTSGNDVFYEINETEESYNISSRIQLNCNADDPGCPTTRWSFSWKLPDNSELISVKDQYGEIEDYDLEGDSISFTTNEGDLDTNQTVEIKASVDESREDRYNGLQQRFISLPGYSGSKTTGIVNSKDLLTATSSQGSKLGFNNQSISFEAEGPINLNLNLGQGKKSNNYVYFGESSINESLSKVAFRTALGVTGNQPKYERLPVMMLEPSVYSREIGDWSSGVYKEATITLKNDLGDREPSVLAHETVHAINDDIMIWDRRETAYLDEGLATYTEHLINKRMYREKETDQVPPELFGEKIEFTERNGGQITRYEIPPNGDKEKLWQYYQEENEFMKDWHPKNSQNRDFAYAYSQLIIRNHLKNNNTLESIYNNLTNIEKDLETNQAKWDRLGQFVDLEPCNEDTREEFEACLEQINEKDFPVLTAEPSQTDESINVENVPLEQRNRSKGIFESADVFSAVKKIQNFKSQFKLRLEQFFELIQRLFE